MTALKIIGVNDVWWDRQGVHQSCQMFDTE